MNLIEQLRARKVAIDKGGEFDDVKRVLDYAFPEDGVNLGMYWCSKTFFFGFNRISRKWTYAETLPNGMKAVDVKEFIKEIDMIEQAKNVLNAEGWNGKKQIQWLENKVKNLTECGQAEKERADKAEAKLNELQPFKRGEEGWGFDKSRGHTKIKKKFHSFDGEHYWVYANDSIEDKLLTRYNDFTTENPHKKETVFSGGDNPAYFKESTEDASVVILNNDSIVSIGSDWIHTYYYTQLGDEDQAKFDDQNNDKWRSLIKQ